MRALSGKLDADVVHYQWLTMPALDAYLLPAKRPRLLTAHYILSPNSSRRETKIAQRLFARMDAVIAHSEHGAARLRDEVEHRSLPASASSPTAPSTISPACPRRSRCQPSSRMPRAR